MSFSRRELCASLPLALMASSFASSEPGLSSAWFPFADLPVRKDNGNEFRNIVKGRTRTGELVEVHETILAPGKVPHGPHHHEHSEFWLIREGTVEITISGKIQRLGAGGSAFAASNDEHVIKNVGETPASYFVVEIGPMK